LSSLALPIAPQFVRASDLGVINRRNFNYATDIYLLHTPLSGAFFYAESIILFILTKIIDSSPEKRGGIELTELINANQNSIDYW
jgi:hypothetical protein